MPTNIKIKTRVVKELPTERPLEKGAVYKVEQPNGDLLTYTINSAGEPVLERGITNDQNTRLERMSSDQISKVESITTGDIDKLQGLDSQQEIDGKINNKVDKESGKSLVSNSEINKLENLKSQSEIDSDIATATSNASSQLIVVSGTVLPRGNDIPEYITTTGKAELLGGNDTGGKTFTNTGKPAPDNTFNVPKGSVGYAYYDKDSDSWSLVDMGELPQVDTSELLDRGGYDGTAQDLYDEIPKEENTNGKIVRAPESEVNYNYENVSGVEGEDGYYRYDNGILVSVASRKYITFPIPNNIPDNEDYVLTGTVDGATSIALAVFFDVSMNYLGYQEHIPSGTVEKDRELLDIPIGTRFIGTGNFNASPQFVLEKRIKITEYKQALFEGDVYSKGEVNAIVIEKADEENAEGKVVRAEKQTEEEYENIEGENLGNGSGYYNYSSGEVFTSTSRKRIIWEISAEESHLYYLSGTINGANNVGTAVYFDSDMNYLGFDERVQSGSVIFNRHELSAIPTGTKYIGSGNNNAETQLILEKKTVIEEYKKALFEGDVYSKEETEELIDVKIGNYIFKCHGDSTTWGADLAEPLTTRWSYLLSQYFPELVFENYGQSGGRTEEITAVMGGLYPKINIPGGIISSTSATSISFIDVEPLRSATLTSINAAIVLQNGSLIKGVYNRGVGFIANIQNDITVDSGAEFRFLSLTGKDSLKHVIVVGMGANNISFLQDATQTIEQICQWYKDAVSQAKDFLIWGWNVRSITELPYVLDLEEYLKKEFGQKFCPLRSYLASEKAISDAQVLDPSYTPVPNDYTQVGQGLIPTSFRSNSGSAHLNERGHLLQANFMRTWIEMYYI